MPDPADMGEPPPGVPTRADPRIAQGSTIGHYRLLGILGEGGFGVVWEAEQFEPVRRRVALKLIKPGMDSGAVVARFEAERQALAVMDHPCIARVFDGGATDTGYPYFVMELVKGEPITDFCDRHRLTIQSRLELFIKVCEAVQHAHMKGVVHRDLKPSNVLAFYRADTPPTDPHTRLEGIGVKVIDFGVAKALNQRLSEHTIFTQRGQMIGTPEYMSPEQAEMSGVDIDTRSDVYSLGVLLYELLTGSLPFDPAHLRAAAFNEIQRIIREVQPPKPSTRLSSSADPDSAETIAHQRRTEIRPLTGLLRRDLDWVVMKCLEKERDRRYDTPNALAADLRRYLSDEPVLAGPPTVRYRLGKFARKHRAPLAAAMLVLLVLLAGIAGTTWGVIRADQRAQSEAIAKVRAQRAEKDAAAALTEQRRLTDLAEEMTRATQDAMQTIEHNSYVSNIQMAGEALDRHQWLALRQRLDACPQPSRRWEWGWLNACADNSLLVLAGHTGSVMYAAFGPDGQRIVTASWDNTARVWDSRSGKCLVVLEGHHSPIVFASLSRDGSRVATASHDSTAKLWNAESGELLFDLIGHAGPVVSACFSPDGKRLVTASHDGSARIWDCASGTALAVLQGHAYRVHFACFNSQGNRIVTASLDQTAKVWDAAGGELVATLSGHTNPLMTASFRLDGERIVTASLDRTARVWDARTGSLVTELAGHTGLVLSATFSPEGERVATASDDHTGRVWDAESGRTIAVLSGHSLPVESVAFSPDGTKVVSASRDQTARVWDAASGAPLSVLTGYTDWVKSASYNQDGTLIVSATRGLSPRVWSAHARPPVHELVGHARSVSAAGFSLDGGRVVTACEDGTVRVWDAGAGIALKEFRCHSQRVSSAAFGPDGKRIVTASYDGTARVWSAVTGELLATLQGHSDLVVGAAFSPNGELIVTASEDSTAQVWDAKDAKPIRTLAGHSRGVMCAQFSPDGRWIVTTSKDGSARVWDAATGATVVELRGHKNWVRYAAFDQSGTRVVTASVDRSARVWDAMTGSQIVELRGHTESINSARFGCDGARIVTASNDRTARVWDATDGSPLVTLTGHSEAVTSAEFSPDGTRIVTASADGIPRIWDSRTFKDRYSGIQLMRRARERMAEFVSSRIQLGEGLDEIRTLIEASPALLPEERVAALAELVHRRDLRERERQRIGRTAQELNNSAWRAVQFPPVAPTVAAQAVQDARQALALVPDHPSYLNTLGVALYRAQQFAQALETLSQSDALHAASDQAPQPADRAFIAMTLWRLDRHDEARAALAAFEMLAAEDRWQNDQETQAWLEEARSLISPEAPPSDQPGDAPTVEGG